MYEFFYHVKFRVVNERLVVKVFLSLEDLFTPVYINDFDCNVIKDKKIFSSIYNQIFEYFDNKKIVINEDDLRLFKQTVVNLNMDLPQIISVEMNKYDEELDNYSNILTPKEIVFIQYADGKSINDKRFNSWEIDNNLDTTNLREKLVKKKILTTGNYMFNLRKAKRDLLLEVVEKYDLDIYGDNNDLVEGIIKELPEEVIKDNFTGTHYSLTKKGQSIISKVDKLLDFNRSFYRTINKLSLEEFHLLSIKKEDYDFNGIGRLLMINNNNTVFFDWSKLDNKDENKNTIEHSDEKQEDIMNLIQQINNNYESKREIEEKDIIEEKDEIDNVIDEELFIEENEKIKQQLEAYKKKRELYEKQQKEKNSLFSEEVYSEKSKSKFLIFILILLGILVLSFSLLYINEKVKLIDLPFKLKDIVRIIKEAFYSVRDAIKSWFK